MASLFLSAVLLTSACVDALVVGSPDANALAPHSVGGASQVPDCHCDSFANGATKESTEVCVKFQETGNVCYSPGSYNADGTAICDSDWTYCPFPYMTVVKRSTC